MSGGQLVVLDRAGRDGKRFPLAEGLATLGCDPACDIRIMLPTVSPHHATVVVHANQTVIRNVCSDETLVNGRCVSVAALRHGDVISIGGRQLRWEYADPDARRPQAPEPALHVPTRAALRRRRGSGALPRVRDAHVRLQLELAHRASMPGSAGGKQVAIVQPQRRDASDQIDKTPPRSPQQANKRHRSSKSDLDTSVSEEQDKTKRKSTARVSPKSSLSNLQTTTKATLWIESRKSSPRKKVQSPLLQPAPRRASSSTSTGRTKRDTPLRLAVLRRAQSASKMRVTKIEGPLEIDHTKQAAIRLMTGHTPKSKSSSPSFVVKKTSPLRRTTRSRYSGATPGHIITTPGHTSSTPDHTSATPGRTSATPGRTSATPGRTSATPGRTSGTPGNISSTPGNISSTLGNISSTPGNTSATPNNTSATPGNTSSTPGHTSTRRSGGNRTVTILEITDSDGRNSSLRNSTASRRSGQKSPKKSFGLTSPRKSALKDPLAKRGTRKTESIKFDLSNLENHSQEEDVSMLSDESTSLALRYSSSPSPRRSIHSRSSRMLQHSLGSASRAPRTSSVGPRSPPSPPSPRPRRSSRGSLIVQRALDDTDTSSYSRRTTKSSRDDSSTATAAAFRTSTLSPSTSRDHLESYSIVDLVSLDNDKSALSTSVAHDSTGSTADTAFGTPRSNTSRKTRSTIEPTLLGSSTPYVKGRASSLRSRSDPSPHSSSRASMSGTQSTVRSSRSKRSKSLSTPENTEDAKNRSKSLSTPENTEDAKKHISVNSTRLSRASRSRSRINDSDLLLLDDDDDSPRTSKRISTASTSARFSSQTANDTELTPTHSLAQENGTYTPENRHSPEEASTPVLSIQNLLDSSQSSFTSQKPTRKARPSFKTKRKTIAGVTAPKTRVGNKSKSLNFSARKTRLRLSNDSVEIMNKNDESEIVTPKSAMKLVPEGVKNKHSTAKKPQSKRSIIDELNESDIVKQLFSSPVKRKLSQSMTDFSRKQLFDDEDFVQSKRPTRNTIAAAGRTPDNSLLDHTESYTPELFVSPISTPTRSPSLEGIKLMFAKTTPENDLRNVRGVKGLLRTPRTRRPIKNDLTNVSGVKKIFARSPKNRLSDVRVKEVFVSSPTNDLRRVSGVKSLFQVAKTRKSPRNELDDVRGVKKLFNTKSPANDLRNVSGVKRTLRRQSPKNELGDLRGVKRVFGREKRNDLSDVSGVEELFNLSNYSSATVSTRAESLFDQLVGKPQIRAVYSKTLSSKTAKKTKGSRAKSLHASLNQVRVSDNNWLEQELNKRLQIKNYLNSLQSASTSRGNRSKSNQSKSLHASLDQVTDVDVLLEQELNKEQQINKYFESMRSVNDSKANKSTPNRSRVNKSKANSSRTNKSKANISKANMSRELQMLATDTVEGEAPLQTSRIRKSTIIQSNESDSGRKKSTSELYGAHTLPIKKRSLVDTSQESALLPLKKRLVVHSTPLKGLLVVHSTPLKGLRGALDVSALRVSPIRADTERDASVASQPKETTEVTAKSTRGTRANTEHLETTANAFVEPSPNTTRGRSGVARPKPASPVKSKQASPAKAKDASPVKTRNASPAKAKRASAAEVNRASPAMAKKASPAKAKKASPPKDQKTSPVKTRKTSPAKAKKASPVKDKKASPVKAKKASPVKAKKASPVKAKKASLVKAKKASPAKSKAVRPVKKTSPVPVKATRSRRNNASLVIAKKSPVMSPKPRATRKRKEPDTTTTPKQSPKKTRATRKNTSVKDDKLKTPKSTRAKVQKATVVVMKPSPQLKPRATRRVHADQSEQETKETTRQSRKTVTVQGKQPESPKKSQEQRKASKTRAAAVQPKTRGRKTAVSESKDITEVEKPEAKTRRGRNTDEPTAKKTKNSQQQKSIEEAKPVRTRGKKVESQESVEPEPEPVPEPVPSARGRRAARPAAARPAAGAAGATTATSRKRKSDTAPDNELPPKVSKSKQVAARGRKQATDVSAQTKNTRKKSPLRGSKEAKVSDAPVKLTRGRNTAAVEPATATKQTEQKTRGRKANIENVPASQVTGKRKRTAAEPSPVKERKTRATRGNVKPEGKPAGRSRRR